MQSQALNRLFDPLRTETSTGPKSNPAKHPTDCKSSIYMLLTKLFSAMEGTKGSEKPIKFLSRYALPP